MLKNQMKFSLLAILFELKFFLLMKIKISFLTETDRSEEREKLLTAKEKSIQSEKNAKKRFGERERK